MMSTLNEILTGTERVLDTPMPTAYTIAISQISWIYVMVLPFQLYSTLGWVTIPASMGKPSTMCTDLKPTCLTALSSCCIHHHWPGYHRQ